MERAINNYDTGETIGKSNYKKNFIMIKTN